MILSIVEPGNLIYAETSRFAAKIYSRKLNAAISASPDTFACARAEEQIVGCLGLYRARLRPTLVETYIPDAFEKISGGVPVDRRLCAEIGTRAVKKLEGSTSTDISLGLIASLLVYASAIGLKYFAFTSNRTVHALAQELGIELICLGAPDLRDADERFKENWHAFFRLRQQCYGFKLEHTGRCLAVLDRLERRGIFSNVPRTNTP